MKDKIRNKNSNFLYTVLANVFSFRKSCKKDEIKFVHNGLDLVSVSIKKEDFIDLKNDIEIDIFTNHAESNVKLSVKKLVDLPKNKGWNVRGYIDMKTYLH